MGIAEDELESCDQAGEAVDFELEKSLFYEGFFILQDSLGLFEIALGLGNLWALLFSMAMSR